MNSTNRKTIAREYAFKFLYKLQLEDFKELKEACANNQDEFEAAIEEFDDSFIERDEEHPDNELTPDIKFYANKIIKCIFSEEERLGEALKACYKSRELDKVTNTVLQVSGAELMFLSSDTPKNVAIDEGINLVKKFGNKEAAAFVNGVLDKFAKNL